MRFISNQVHGMIDYALAVALIVLPFVLGFQAISPIGHWLSVGAGAGLFVYSLLTGYSLGLRKMIPYGAHLALDFAAGLVFLAAPFVFGFTGQVQAYFLAVGVAVVLVVLLSDPKEASPAKTA